MERQVFTALMTFQPNEPLALNINFSILFGAMGSLSFKFN